MLDTVGGMDDVAPMAGRRRYYRVQISGGTAEAWTNLGRPMVAEIAERDVRFARGGPGVLIVKLAKGAHGCGVASLDVGLDADQAGSREKMIEVNLAVMEAVGMSGEPAEMRERAESMLQTYDAGGGGSAAPPAGGADPRATPQGSDG